MGNKICVDKKPSPIDNLISFNPESLKQSEISNLSKQIKTNNNSYQHLNMWCLCEIMFLTNLRQDILIKIMKNR